MNPGTFDQRVTLRALGTGQDAIGQPLQVWGDVATIWANVRYTSGVEATKADAATSTVRASIRIRHRDGLTTAMRAVHGSTVFEIKSLLPAKRLGYIDLVCEATNAQS